MRLASAAALLSESYHTPIIPIMEPLLDEGLAMAKRALDETAFSTAWAEGRAMSLEESIAEALAVEVGTEPPAPAPVADARRYGPVANLTAAEAQVLRLLAGGRTTKEIAAELVVAVSTVDRHLTHIYQKLGVSNRAGAVAFALTQGLV